MIGGIIPVLWIFYDELWSYISLGQGRLILYCLFFCFRTTNNKAIYELYDYMWLMLCNQNKIIQILLEGALFLIQSLICRFFSNKHSQCFSLCFTSSLSIYPVITCWNHYDTHWGFWVEYVVRWTSWSRCCWKPKNDHYHGTLNKNGNRNGQWSDIEASRDLYLKFWWYALSSMVKYTFVFSQVQHGSSPSNYSSKSGYDMAWVTFLQHLFVTQAMLFIFRPQNYLEIESIGNVSYQLAGYVFVR